MPEYMQEQMLPDDYAPISKPEENAQDDHRAFIPNVHFELIPIKNLVLLLF
jgi:hypothetical protein